jgi:hypothetical protein
MPKAIAWRQARRRFVRLALAALAAAMPATVQAIELECEVENVESFSVGGRQPIQRVYVEIVRATIDLGARTALLRSESPEGTPLTALRNLLVATADEIVMCQADTCQRQVPEEGGWSSTIGLTTINLRTGRLSRQVEGTQPNTLVGGTNRRTIVRDGLCRRV